MIIGGTIQGTSSYCTEVRIPPDSELVGRSLLEQSSATALSMLTCWSCSVGENGCSPPWRTVGLRPVIICCLRVTRQDLLRLQQDHTVQLTTQGQNAGFQPEQRGGHRAKNR